MGQTLMLELPDAVFEGVKRLAEAIRQPVDNTAARIVELGLLPLLNAPKEFEGDLKALEVLNDEELWEIMQSFVPLATQQRLHRLLSKNQLGTLTESERLELEALQKEADLVMLRKAHAAVILKWRGHRIPTLQELQKMGGG